MQLPEVRDAFRSLDLFDGAVFLFSLLIGLLRTDLVEGSLSILSTLLHLSHPLHLSFLLLFLAEELTCRSFFPLDGLTLVLGDLGIKLSLVLTGRLLLLESILVSKSDFLIADLNPLLLLLVGLDILLANLLDVGM